jgi:hypothetical protein
VLPHPHPPFGHLLPSREKADTLASRLDCLLPLWEKVAKPDDGEAANTGVDAHAR